MNSFQRILVVSAHTDDGELGCGASIYKWACEGRQVYYLAFSAAEESVPPSFSKDELRKEVVQSTETLGINFDAVQILKYPVRRFTEYRQDILDEMMRAKLDIHPDLILLPSLNDIHQDHQVVSQEGTRAFKHCCILGYELPWNMLSVQNTCYSIVSLDQVEKKYEALQCYKTQAGRIYFHRDFIYGLAKVRGVQANTSMAECFEVIRWMI